MAWIANPFSYVAINTVIPLIPSIAEKLSLSTGMAGIVCSLWMFARLAAFAAFWRWTGWHYRFRWLAGSFLLMIVCFFGFLMAQSIGLLLVAQVGFGLSIGLIYYSSLYYSMNVTENQGSNAGLHEAMIGAGLFIGPAVGCRHPLSRSHRHRHRRLVCGRPALCRIFRFTLCETLPENKEP